MKIKTDDIIKALRCHDEEGLHCENCSYSFSFCVEDWLLCNSKKLMDDAADRLEQLQADYNKMSVVAAEFRQLCHEQEDKIEQLQAELAEVKAERDALHIYYKDLINKPDCNDCKAEDCQYRPQWGEVVRVNCPLWRGVRKEEPNAE